MDNKRLKFHCCVVPVTALAICAEKVISGSGSEISVFDVTTKRLEARKQIFIGASVHGFKKGPKNRHHHQLLCVYGAKQVCIISLHITDGGCDIEVLSAPMDINDWIWDVQWLVDQSEPTSISLALAHNSVVRLDWTSRQITDVRECAVKCLLYCAHFIGSTWDSLLLAAGTVFNQVVVWPVTGLPMEEGEINTNKHIPVEVLHTFSGHKGVIFSICYHDGLQRICSASDDRSIRMWQLSFLCGRGKTPSIRDWKFMESELLLSLYGHSARVWDVDLMSHCFASVGEDATCYIWDYNGNAMQKFKGHKGRSIWSMATSEDEKFVVTGGGDASIHIWEIQQEKTIQMSQVVISLPSDLNLGQDDFPRIVKMLNFDTVLVMMNSGTLFSYQPYDQVSMVLTCDPKYRSYSVVNPSPDKCTVALGSMTGAVKFIRLPNTQGGKIDSTEKSLFDGKVLCLAWLDALHVLASGPKGICFLLKVIAVKNENEEASFDLWAMHKLLLPISKHCWVTAASFGPYMSQESEVPTSSLVCGDKDGSVHYYFLADANSPTTLNAPETKANQSFTRVHGKAGVTFICTRDNSVYTAGRDGFYRQWEVKDGKLMQLYGSKILKGFEWIEHLEWDNGDLLVYGFFSSQFVVWSVTFNQQLMSVDCGGGHRAWGCCLDNTVLRFVYLKAGKIHMEDSGHQTKQIILQGALHGREICDVSVIQVVEDREGSPVHVVCSASEDTTISVGMFKNNGKFTCWKSVAVLKGHLSSIRALALSSCNSHSIGNSTFSHVENKKRVKQRADSEAQSGSLYANPMNFILFSGGGRAEIRAHKLSVKGNGEQLKCETSDVSNYAQTKASCDDSKNIKQTDSYDSLQGKLSDETDDHLSSNQCASCIHGTSQSDSSDSASSTEYTFPIKTMFNPSYPVQCSYEHMATHFLGESRHKKMYSSWKAHKLQLDPETRIMSLAASSVLELGERMTKSDVKLKHISKVHILSVAGSDGVFRIFAFDENSRKFSTLGRSSFHQGCVLKVIHYTHLMKEQKILPLALSASTNGQIVIWSLDTLLQQVGSNMSSICNEYTQASENENASDRGNEMDGSDDEENADYSDYTNCQQKENVSNIEPEWEPVLHFKAHQSGVNSLQALQISESQLLVASGGDDNALTIHLLQISGSSIEIKAKTCKADAHGAQITGIALVSPQLVVSVSIDQRISIWKIQRWQNRKMHLEFLDCKYINVADVSSMDFQIYGDSVYLYIGGEGLCLYSFKN